MKVRALGSLVVLAAGCAFTTMNPAHKLEKGELVVQGGVDAPGVLYIPRLSGALSYGTGGGDIGAHVGTTVFYVNAGATGLFYLVDRERWALSLQSDFTITSTELSLFTASERFGFVTLNPRLGTVLGSNKEHLYGGFQFLGILPFNISDGADLPSGPGFAPGGYIGWADDTRGNIDYQIELSASPIGIFPGLNEDSEAYSLTMTPIFQIGFSFQYRQEQNTVPSPSAPPAETPRGPDPIL